MISNKIVISLVAVMALVVLVNGKTVPSQQLKKNSNNVDASKVKMNVGYANALKLISEFRKLKQRLSDNEMRIVSAVGLVAGALHIEDALRENLYNMADELFDTFAKATPKENTNRLLAIEETINRDKVSIAVLNEMLKFVRNETDLVGFQKEMQHIAKLVSDFSYLQIFL